MMETSFQKFLKRMLLEKYPMFLDVHVVKNANNRLDVIDFTLRDCYDVFLVISEKDWKDMENRFSREIKEYVKNLAKYMGLTICGVYNYTVDEDEWQ